MRINNVSNKSNLQGIVFMLINVLSVAVIYTLMKILTKTMSSNQAVFFYKITVLVFGLPWFFRNGLSVLKTSQFKLHLIRGFMSVCGALCFMHGIKLVGVMNATAIGYLEQVLIVLIGIFYFKETTSSVKISAITASFIGAVLIIYPEIFSEFWNAIKTGHFVLKEKEFNQGYFFVLAGIVSWSLNTTVLKILGNKNARNDTQAFYVLLFAVIFAYPITFINWEFVDFSFLNVPIPSSYIPWSEINISSEQWLCISAMSICYFIHVIAFYLSISRADFSVVMPYEYSKLIFTTLFGTLLLGETLKESAYYGYAIIFLAGLALAKSEHRKHKLSKNERSKEIEAEIEKD
jgi:drug/metabolite transporter (DMT)-like permease